MIGYLRSIFFWFNFIFFTFFLTLFLPPLSLFFKEKEKFYFLVIAFFCRLLLIISWIPVEVLGKENLEKIKKEAGLIIAVNHASFLDQLILFAKLPFPFKFAVLELGFRLPVLRTFYRQMGYIGVGLREGEAPFSSLSLYQQLKKGEKLLLFSKPSDNEKEVIFNEGILRLSKHSQIPILPLAIKNSAKVLPLGKFLLRWGKIEIGVGQSSFFLSPSDLQNQISQLYSFL